MKALLIIGLPLILLGSLFGEIEMMGEVQFKTDRHELVEKEDLSAVCVFGENLMIGSDEGTSIQILEREEADGKAYQVKKTIELFPSETEMDIEGIAREGDAFYILGSHSLKRLITDDDDASKGVSRENYKNVILEPSRCNIFRLEMDLKTKQIRTRDSINLRPILLADPFLAPFCHIPGKENGIDIEGIAIDGDELYLAFRSPVLRGNLVPIMKTHFSKPSDYELLFLSLQGFGLRDIVKVSDGFLLLLGPPGDGMAAYFVFWWNGKDGFPDPKKERQAKLVFLGKLTNDKNESLKAEGITVLQERPSHYEVLVVYDGIAGGLPTRYKIDRPREDKKKKRKKKKKD